jgi:hypothetical protein
MPSDFYFANNQSCIKAENGQQIRQILIDLFHRIFSALPPHKVTLVVKVKIKATEYAARQRLVQAKCQSLHRQEGCEETNTLIGIH